MLIETQACRQASRIPSTAALRPSRIQAVRLTALQIRLLSQETKQAIDKAVGSAPVVLFMKGTPETPQCGFSRASIQILGLQGVDPNKFTAFNVLEDEELRQGMSLSLQCDVVAMQDVLMPPQELRNTLSGPPFPSYTSIKNSWAVATS